MKLLAALATALCAATLAAVPAQAAPRVAALTPFAASTITRLGVRPVAIGQTLGGNDQYLASLRGVPVLKLSHPLGPNLEQLATHDPSIVLSSKTWQRGTRADAPDGDEGLRERPDERRRDRPRDARDRRRARPHPRREHARTKIEKDVAAAKRGISRRPRVLVILGVGRTPHAMLANSWGGDVVRQAGGNLLTQGLTSPSGTARISDEIVVKRNPDIIIAVPHGTPGNIPRLAAYYRNNPNWRNTRAVRNKRVYVATGNSLLQPYPGVASTIRDVRRKFLRN